MSKSYIFRQSTGELFERNPFADGPYGLEIGKGYAGREAGKNNPDMQEVKGIGPLPCGWYTAQSPTDDPVVGKYAMRLIPDKGNQMFGRNSFFMHGDSSEHPGLASHGCIIQQLAVRQKFWTDPDSTHVIEVVK